LNLWGTWVSALPQTITRLKKLKKLDLDNTHFREIPDSIGDLSSLEYLSCNPSSSWRDTIIKIPDTILNCKSLKTLRLNRETLENRSPIIWELKKRGVDVSS